MSEEKKSIVKVCNRFEKADWKTNQGHQLYAFWVEMENGDKGKYNAKDPNNPKFVVGKEVLYTFDGKNIKKVSEKPSDSYGGYKKSPEDLKKIVYLVALETAILTVVIPKANCNHDALITVTNHYYEWLSIGHKSESISRQAMLKRAVLCMEIKDMNITGSANVLELADKFIENLKNIK